jgi:uncharacterized protein (DUF924 family)
MGHAHDSEKVLEFWLKAGPPKWYVADDAFDQEIRDQFGDLWEQGARGELEDWTSHPNKALALIIVLDQFSRNMFRQDGRAFSTDSKAKAAARYSIKQGWDMRIDEPQRQFFYLPLMHSEMLSDQDQCVRMFKERMPETGAPNLLHARAHREVIREFGRFPYRNAALGRETTPAEQTYLDNGAYGFTLRKLEAADQAG